MALIFKVGDRVKILKMVDGMEEYVGLTGVIEETKYYEDVPYHIKLDKNKHNQPEIWAIEVKKITTRTRGRLTIPYTEDAIKQKWEPKSWEEVQTHLTSTSNGLTLSALQQAYETLRDPVPSYFATLRTNKSEGEGEVRTKMTHKFTIGDKVKLIADEGHWSKGETGEIRDIGEGLIGVRFDRKDQGHNLKSNGKAECEDGYGWYCENQNLMLISSVTETMAYFNELTEEQKAHMDEDSQALYRTGLINSNFSYGDSSLLLNALLKLNYKALATQAKAQIAAEEAKQKKATK